MSYLKFLPALAALSFATLTIQASPDMPPETLKALVKENWHRNITDADFFGAFKNGAWEKKPMLDYASSPKLKKVEEAAKAGDYDKAASELLAYFQTRDCLWPKPQGWDQGRVELWEDNIFGFDQQIHLVTVFDLDTEPGLHSLDVLKTLRRGTLTFELMGRHKNGVVSYVASRKSDSPPTLELQFKDGSTASIKPSADTFVRAGKFAGENYGTAKTLEVCNSGLKVGQPFDDDTRQTLIGFDLSKIDPANVKKADLKLKAWSSKPGQKLILFHSLPTIVIEAKDTWDTHIENIYSWEGLPDGVSWWVYPKGAGQISAWVQRLPWFDNMSAMALGTGDLEEGKTTFRLIRSFAATFPTQNQCNIDLNTCSQVSTLARLLPYLFKIKACTPRDCVELLKFVVRQGTMLYLDQSKLRKREIDNMAMGVISGLVHGSVGFPELADSKLWMNDANARFTELLKHLVLKDGAYCEHTFGYPFGVLNSMLDMNDLYKHTPFKVPEALPNKCWQLARYLMLCSMPDGTPPDWGEGSAKNSATSPAIKRAGEVFNDPELQWWTSGGKTGHPPQSTTVSFPEAKICVIRDSWKPDANVLFASSRVGGSHYHVDQNAVDLYAYGRNLINDTGMTSYNSRERAFDWQRAQAKSHNTVEVDEKGYPRLETYKKDFMFNQEGPCGSSVLTAPHAVLFEGWAGGYLNVRHERRVLSLKEAGLYFVADLLKPNDGKSHIYDQCWHIYPLDPYKTDDKTCQVWTEDSNQANIEIMPLYPQKLQLLVRDGFNAVPLMDTTYPSFRQELSGDAEFLTILAPTRPMVPAKSLKATLLAAPKNVESAEIAAPQGRGVFLISYANATVKVRTIETDGRCAYVQFGQDGKVLWSVMVGGNTLRVDGKETPFELMVPLSPPALPIQSTSSRGATAPVSISTGGGGIE